MDITLRRKGTRTLVRFHPRVDRAKSDDSDWGWLGENVGSRGVQFPEARKLTRGDPPISVPYHGLFSRHCNNMTNPGFRVPMFYAAYFYILSSNSKGCI